MGSFVTAILGTLTFAVASFANNIALDPAAGGNASITTNSSIASSGWSAMVNGVLTYFPATDAVDNTGCPFTGSGCNAANEWVAPGGTVEPYLLINLDQLASINALTVSGAGNTGLTTSFDIFVSPTNPSAAMTCLNGLTTETNATAATCLATIQSTMSLVLTVLNQPDGTVSGVTGWTDTASFSPTQAQFILYYATNSTLNCPVGGCFAGDGTYSGGSMGQDDAFTTGITVNSVNGVIAAPEPATITLFSVALLGLGFAWHSRKQSC